MKKGENRKTWKGFFFNLFGVILGIMLTFGVNSLWEKRQERKKVKEMLILVRNELKINKNWFKNQEKLIKNDAYIYKKILAAKGDWSTIPIDTLHAYRSEMTSMTLSQLTTLSWQVFQNSEIIQKMSDKELIIRLSECYFWINKIHEIIMVEYWNEKKKTNAFERDPYKYFEGVMHNKESLYFYESMSSDDNDGFEEAFFTVDAFIDYVLLMLDKSGNFQYDMDDENNEFVSFFKARIDSVYNKRDTIQNTNMKSENQ
jgi:hypothetical protein